MNWDTYHTGEIKDKFVYRYLSFEKLIHFLSTGSLYLARLDQFEDNLEGISPYEINEIRYSLKLKVKPEYPNPNIPEYVWNRQIKTSKDSLTDVQRKLLDIQKKRFVSCWFLGDVESIGMWDLYANSGFAIRFDREYFQNIIKEGIKYPENLKTGLDLIVIGKVTYQNFDDMLTKEKQSLLKYSVFRKHLSFKHEEEFRLIGFHKEVIESIGLEYKLGAIIDLEFDIFANPRMNALSFSTYSEIIKHYSERHKLMESKLKNWLELRNKKF
jgi:Protein of unknown function (DUF2971)